MKKRLLAAPFVLTAMLSPALADSPPPNPNPPPPPPEKPGPPRKDWGQVVRRPDGTCLQLPPATRCPPNVHCNPPPPRQVECPPPPATKK